MTSPLKKQTSVSDIFTMSEEEIYKLSILKKNRNASGEISYSVDEYLDFLQDYNEMINHRQTKEIPKNDFQWDL